MIYKIKWVKIIILLCCFLFNSNRIFSQTDTASLKILETLIRKQHRIGTIYYADRLSDEQILRIKQSFTKRKIFFNRGGIGGADSILLSKNERKYIDSCINRLNSHTWNDNLFNDSKIIHKDSIWSRLSKQNKLFYENQKAVTTNDRKNYTINDIVSFANTFQFSNIIYLRTKKIFLVYILRVCGSLCGEDELAFYKLIDGSYKKWIVLSSGVF